MTGDVVSHGDEDRRGLGRAIGVAVTLVLLAVVGVAVARSRRVPEALPSPSPSPSSLPPAPRPTSAVPDRLRFAEYVTVDPPPPDVVTSVLFVAGVPGFLVGGTGLPAALTALGGPPHDRTIVGWCAAQRTFRSPDGRYVYDRSGAPFDGGPALPLHDVRRNAGDERRVDVGQFGTVSGRVAEPAGAPAARECPDPLVLPVLPPRVTAVHETRGRFRQLRGRFVITTETRRFCALGTHPRCLAGGWEDYGAGLPPGSLASTYVYEGEFLVLASGERGSLNVVRLPGARRVTAERVGAYSEKARVLAGTRRDGVVRLHLEGAEDVTLRRDAEVYLGRGITGLGEPRGTPSTLLRYLLGRNGPTPLWLVYDDDGVVIRVVAEDL